MFLNHYSTITEFSSPHFFHESHLTSPEKEFGLAKLVLVLVLDEFGDNIFASSSKITSFDVFGLAQDTIANKEIIIGPSGRVS
jgi:hypothetical protein